MINFIAYMLRDTRTGRWYNYGGLTEWLPANMKTGGTIWYDINLANRLADEYNARTEAHGVIAEVVEIHIVEMPKEK